MRLIKYAFVVSASLCALAFTRGKAFAQSPPCTFPSVPPSTVTSQQDHDQMMCQVGVTSPALPSKLVDPNQPPDTFPKSATAPQGDWQNAYGHTITRSDWGLWNNYDDDLNGVLPSGSDGMTLGAPDSWRVFDDPPGPNAPYS
jgi:hypothetical protein